LNRADPVTFVRSPTFTKRESGPMFTASSPESLSLGSGSGRSRGGWSATTSAMALMCSGVVPQQPPTMFSQPLLAQSPISSAMNSGVSSYSPNSLGRPALG
jgi:hypothetical protein